MASHTLPLLFLFGIFSLLPFLPLPLPVLTQSTSCNAQPLWLTLGPCNITQADAKTIFSWGALISVGSTSQICITPSTVVNTSLLLAPSICASGSQLTSLNMSYPQCASRRGGFVNPAQLAVASESEKAALPALNPDWGAIQGSDAFNDPVDATLNLRAGSENDVTFTELLVLDGQNSTTAQLALADKSSLLDALVASGRIQSRSWGLDSGSTSIDAPRDGSVTLGGYDSSAVDGAFVEYSMSAYSEKLNGRSCPLQVTVETLAFRQSGKSDVTLVDASWSLQACLEPYDNLYRFPDRLTNTILPLVSSAQPLAAPVVPGLWINEPGITYLANSTAGFNGSLVFTLNNNFTVELPNYELLRPLRGLDINGAPVVDNRFRELQVYHDPNAESEPLLAAVLGKNFMSQVYVFADYDSRVFKLANLNTESTSPVPYIVTTNGEQACSSHGTGLSGTTIGLIVVGVVLALLLISLGVHVGFRWYMKNRPGQVSSADGEVGDNPPENGAEELHEIGEESGGDNPHENVAEAGGDNPPENVAEAGGDNPQGVWRRGTIDSGVSGTAISQ